MRHSALLKSPGKPVWQLRSQLATRHPNPRVYYANGFGTVPLGQCAKYIIGRAVLSGRRASNAQKKLNRCPKVWIGSFGSARHHSVLSTTLTCLLFGAAGATSVVALWATWVPTVSTRFFAS